MVHMIRTIYRLWRVSMRRSSWKITVLENFNIWILKWHENVMAWILVEWRFHHQPLFSYSDVRVLKRWSFSFRWSCLRICHRTRWQNLPVMSIITKTCWINTEIIITKRMGKKWEKINTKRVFSLDGGKSKESMSISLSW